MTNAELIKALRALKYNPGPINPHSRALYERIYVKLLHDASSNAASGEVDTQAPAAEAAGTTNDPAAGTAGGAAVAAAGHVTAAEASAVAAHVAGAGEDGGEAHSSQTSTVVEGSEGSAHAEVGDGPAPMDVVADTADTDAPPLSAPAPAPLPLAEDALLNPVDLPPAPVSAGAGELEDLFSGAEDSQQDAEPQRPKVYRKATGATAAEGQGGQGVAWVPLLMLAVGALAVAVFGQLILTQ